MPTRPRTRRQIEPPYSAGASRHASSGGRTPGGTAASGLIGIAVGAASVAFDVLPDASYYALLIAGLICILISFARLLWIA